MTKEIRQLPEVTTPATTDWYILQKASNNQTSKISGANLIPANSVTNAALAGGITGDKLATNLGSAVKVTAITGISSITDLTGLTITVTVATGNTVRLDAFVCATNKFAGANGIEVYIKEGATVLATGAATMPAVNYTGSANISCILTPTAGSHIYKLAAASVNNSCDTLPPSYIIATVID